MQFKRIPTRARFDHVFEISRLTTKYSKCSITWIPSNKIYLIQIGRPIWLVTNFKVILVRLSLQIVRNTWKKIRFERALPTKETHHFTRCDVSSARGLGITIYLPGSEFGWNLPLVFLVSYIYDFWEDKFAKIIKNLLKFRNVTLFGYFSELLCAWQT
jgi:hypothetical protein